MRRLRTRVTLYFLLTALPGALASAGAVVLLDRLIHREIAERAAGITRQAKRVIEDENDRIGRALRQISELDDIRRLAGSIDDADVIARAEGLASARASAAGLDLLAIVAEDGPEKGTIVSSAHLPDAVGDRGPEFLGATAIGVAHELVEGNPPEMIPALMGVERVRAPDGAPRLSLYGGSRLDGPRLQSIARMGGATLVLRSPPLPPREFSERAGAGGGRAGGSKIALTDLERGGGEGTHIDVEVHSPSLAAARTTFLSLSVFLVLASLLVAIVSSGLLSSRITGPIVELSEAAREIGKGNLDVRIEPRTHDEVGALVAVFNDMAREIGESRDRLARAERIAAWQQIARRVAHEIKNPLFPIQMSIETLEKSYAMKHEKLDEIVEESTRTVLEEVRALNRIVTEFSEFARLPAPRREPVPIADMLGHVASLYRDLGKVSISVDHGGDTLSVDADREQIQQALINLVKNSVEAIGERGGRVWLSAGEKERHGTAGIEITVRDDGPGIPPEVRERIFTPYFTTKESGTGLGLSIVDRIATEHGGAVDLESTPGTGTSMRIWLPATS
jgi:signal transduction histidine kinase